MLRRHLGTRPLAAPALLLAVAGWAAAAEEHASPSSGASAAAAPADRLVASIEDRALHDLLVEILARNPEIERARAHARAAGRLAPIVRALPDPTAALTAYLLEPETRTGPQNLALSYSQTFPWSGTLSLREQAALEEAAAARARLEAVRLEIVTEARRWYHELAFLRIEERILREERRTLVHFEELARTRYESGRGLQQGAIKIQAEITRTDLELLAIEERRDAALAALNSLRDRPTMTPQGVGPLPPVLDSTPDAADLRRAAAGLRPEVVEADAAISASVKRVELARLAGKPDLTLGVGYTFVGGREDAAGRANPPADEGDDVLSLTAGARLPVWRGKVRAQVERAAYLSEAAAHGKTALLSRIERELADLASRLRVSRDRVALHEGLLVIQAEQSLSSGLSAYSAGSLGALELLDAERILFDVRISAQRARADHAIARARIEGATAAPLRDLATSASPTDEADHE